MSFMPSSPSLSSTLSVSPSPSRCPSPAPSADFSPNISKREYLLAQIRQKDSIIDSLLKQLHNPYIATPLSIASYRMATSPSDSNNRNVLAWLDRLQSSVRDAGKPAGPRAFSNPRDRADEESDVDSEGKRTHAATILGGLRDDPEDTFAEAPADASEKLQSSLPESHVPLGLIADLSLSNTKSKKKRDQTKDLGLNEEDLNDDNVGVANETYFMPGPATDLDMRASLIEQHSAPEILVHNLVNPEDVEKLFEMYYVEKSEIYPIAMHFAKHSAANALIDGWKSVELCQAYILMSVYAVPARRWEEDRSWLYTGLAIRIATDLNLHQVPNTKPHSETQEREILNKTRVWMICFNLDRSTATQLGKPSTLKEDFIVRNAPDWYKKSQYNLKYDVHLCGYSALLQIVAKFHDEVFSDPSSPTGLNKKVDFRSVTLKHDTRLKAYNEEWSKRFKEDSDVNDPTCALRCSLLPFLVGYSRLVMFSFGFQQAYQRGFENEDRMFFTTCLDSAKAVIENMIDGLAPTGFMRYAPDGHFVFASFASAFLLKLLRPEFSAFLEKEQENEIFDLIGRLIQTLSSPKIAIDDRHTPKLYARFLAGLLSRHRRDGATLGRLQTVVPPQSQMAGSENQGMSSMSLASMMSTSHSSDADQGGQTFTHAPSQAMETPIYMPEATFATSTGQIHFGADFDMTYGGVFSDEEMLATMQAIKNPAWWQNMMMPGFSWPEGSPSPPAIPNANLSPLPYLGHMQAPSYGIFHAAQPQVMMS
ncbi:Protein priB [Psilocybe cubensis]|uniref:Protein priB n=1 Tax=Psilocybe cubensis TaxID=181762 RepID=A0ACB8GHS2_PSICU|nr:Protein priB [Psilocybe cubensis]KAH9475248.1 Protein priB [Psilocybe cubensis]